MTATHAVPHWWLAQYGHTNFEQDVEIDADDDGHAAWQEYRAGTDPTDRASVFKVIGQGETQGTRWVRWTGGGSTTQPPFEVLATTSLVNWFQVGSVARGAYGTNTWSDAPGIAGNAVYYRIRIPD